MTIKVAHKYVTTTIQRYISIRPEDATDPVGSFTVGVHQINGNAAEGTVHVITYDEMDMFIAALSAVRNAARLDVSADELWVCGSLVGTWDGTEMTILAILDPFREINTQTSFFLDYHTDHYIGEKYPLKPENVKKFFDVAAT